MSSPSFIAAARHFLAITLEGAPPGDRELAHALDLLAVACHDLPEGHVALDGTDPPRRDYDELYKQLCRRFPTLGLYSSADPAAELLGKPLVGDAIDDLADIVLDMEEAVWRAENLGADDANWFIRTMYFHWGGHMRELMLHLHHRQYP